jgi:hypothetical protein
MSEWVLVPSEVDDETCEDIWDVAYGEWAEFGSMDKDAGRAAVVAMLALRPPIPRAVWGAMVERGARGLILESGGNPDDTMFDDKLAWRWYVPNGDVFLRAALGHPQVEEDEP